MTNAMNDRWTAEYTSGAISVLTGEEIAAVLPFGLVDGRWDLRGLRLDVQTSTRSTKSTASLSYTLTEVTDIRNVSWAGLDLSKAVMPELRLTNVVVENCKFVGADLSGLRMWATLVTSTDFTKADLSNSMVGAWTPGRSDAFHNCTFDGANLRDLGTDAGEFVGCSFQKSMLRSTSFMSTVFKDCVFSGRLRGLQFDGRDLGDSTAVPGATR